MVENAPLKEAIKRSMNIIPRANKSLSQWTRGKNCAWGPGAVWHIKKLSWLQSPAMVGSGGPNSRPHIAKKVSQWFYPSSFFQVSTVYHTISSNNFLLHSFFLGQGNTEKLPSGGHGRAKRSTSRGFGTQGSHFLLFETKELSRRLFCNRFCFSKGTQLKGRCNICASAPAPLTSRIPPTLPHGLACHNERGA